MGLDPVDVSNMLNPTIEKLEVVTALSPVLDSNIQQMHTMSVLLDIANDYVRELRRRLDQLVAQGTVGE
jgi:hypothetical protein